MTSVSVTVVRIAKSRPKPTSASGSPSFGTTAMARTAGPRSVSPTSMTALRPKRGQPAEGDRREGEQEIRGAQCPRGGREDARDGGRGEEREMPPGDVDAHGRSAQPRAEGARDERRRRSVVRAGDHAHEQKE